MAMGFLMVGTIRTTVTQRVPASQRNVRETFLAGSEFEESLITHLLNSSTMVTLNDDISSLLSSSNLTYTLASPEKPFVFVDRNYFWNKADFVEYADSDNTTTFAYICVYNVTQDDGIFSQIYFPSGEPITEVVFGCETSKECCGMKCCGDDVLINIIIVGAISLALLFLLLCNIVIGFKKRREKARNNGNATYHATDITQANENEIVSADQITYETRHPSATRGKQCDIETLSTDHKKI
uniref:CX domain-containing protein n=2 Tax=Caenorhabditis tropicalis TaxID=1561998 RepID=A0A1I7V1Y3_9PELO